MTPDPSRARSLLIALAVGVAALLGVTAWMAISRASEKPTPLASASGSSATPVSLSAAQQSGAERVDLSTSLAVSSRAGLPIQSVFLFGADGAWHSRRADEGKIERTELQDMTRICAPGHKPAALDAHAASIVLDADAMLIVRGLGLKACLEKASPVGRNDFAACTGFIDDDTLGCAVACELMPDPARAVAFDLAWQGRLTTRVELHAESGKTAEWRTTCPTPPPADVLVLHVARNGADGFAVKVAGRVEPLAGARPSAEGTGPDAAPLQSETAYPWGTAVTSWHAFEFEQTARGGLDEVHVANVPLGAQVGLTAQDPDFGGWGMLACIHDGSAHEILLRPAVKLHGKVTVADDSPLPARLEIDWLARFAAADAPAWNTSDAVADVAGDGTWSVTGPRRMRCGAASSSVIPPLAEVQITAPGFATATIHKAGADAQEIELDNVRLEPFAPDLLLRSKGAEGVDGFRSGCEVNVQRGTGEVSSLRIGRVWRRADGSIGVWFRRSSAQVPGRDPDRVAPIVAAGVRLAASTQWREWRGFARGLDATFNELDTQSYELEIVLPKDSERVWMRTTWFGIDCESKLLIPRGDKALMQSLKMPAGPVQLRWKCAKPDSEWSSAPLLPGRQRFERIACPSETKK